MDKKIDLSKSLYEICNEYPDVMEMMRELGFKDITTPGMLNTAGRFMTIPKGAKMKNIAMEKIREKFQSKGYELKE